jgi:hypothetical protein
MASGVSASFSASSFSLSDVPRQKSAQKVASGGLKAEPHVFRFEEIHEVHRVTEANEAGGHDLTPAASRAVLHAAGLGPVSFAPLQF